MPSPFPCSLMIRVRGGKPRQKKKVFPSNCFGSFYTMILEAYSEPLQTSKMEHFSKQLAEFIHYLFSQNYIMGV